MDHLQEGLALVTQAVQYDSNGDASNASAFYEKAILSLEKAYVVEADPSRKSLISQKLLEYKNRNDVLMQQLTTQRMSAIGVGTLPMHQQLSTSQNIVQQPPPIQQGTNPILAQYKPAFACSKVEAYQAAAELCQKGAAEDEAQRYESALSIYKAALEYFNKVLQEETSSEMRQKVIERMTMYTNRAEQIAAAIGKNPSLFTTTSNNNNNNTNSNYQHAASGGGLSCGYCKQPIDPVATYKISAQNVPYHAPCFENTVGLEKEATKTFFMSSDHLSLKVRIPKKVFAPGEEFEMFIHVENRSSKLVKKVTAYFMKIETQMQITTGGHYGVERKAKTRENKFGRRDYYGINNQFPLEHGVVTLPKATFNVPGGMPLSELSGAFSREYELVVKCVLPKPTPPHKLVFPVTISR